MVRTTSKGVDLIETLCSRLVRRVFLSPSGCYVFFVCASVRRRLSRPWPVDISLTSENVELAVVSSHAGVGMFHSSPLRVLSLVRFFVAAVVSASSS